MLRRSLTAKIYVYAVIAFSLLAFGLHEVLDTLSRNQDNTFFQQRLAPQIEFLSHEVEAVDPTSTAGRKRLSELERAMSVELMYFPWSQSDRYPAELTKQALVTEPGTRRGPLSRLYWVRIDPQGKVIGAMRIRFRPAFRSDPNRRTFLLGQFMLALGLVLFPPITLWVIRPVRRLEAAVHRLAAGDLETPIASNRQDELGRLAGAFDGMRQRVKSMLHEKERLLIDVSHEIRGPLARMAVAQDLLEEDYGDNPYVTRLRNELHEVDQLTGDLLALARSRADTGLNRGTLSLDDVVAELVGERELQVKQRQVTLHLNRVPLNITADRQQIRRALGNLLDNAIKYTPANGSITVSLKASGSNAIVEVRDTGVGIPADSLPHIFEPFYRPDTARSRETGGNGLGLAIVKSIIDQNEGTIALTSAPGAGTTATVSLPLQAPPLA